MTLTVTHVFVSTRATSSDPTIVSQTQWNSSHSVSGVLESSNISGTFLSSQIATVGSSQLTGTLLSSQGGTGNTTLGVTGNLVYNSSGVLTAMTGSSWVDATAILTLSSASIIASSMRFNTAVAGYLHVGAGGL